MKITKQQLRQIIQEELLNEIGVPISQVGGGAPVADPHTAAIDSLEDYVANHYPSDDALRELVENVQDLVAEFEDDMQDKLAEKCEEETGGFEIQKIRTGYLVVDKDSGEGVLGPFQSEDEAIESLRSIERNPNYQP